MRNITTVFMFLCFCVFMLALPACEGTEEKCSTKLDMTKVTVELHTITTGGDEVIGAAGATDAGATVTITDSHGNTVTTTANDDGSFRLLIASLQYSRGTNVTIKSQKEGCEAVERTLRIPNAWE